jgi:NAD(P)-dependent dehydrogenase (short-subunit alcohol dehydrogenase family)
MQFIRAQFGVLHVLVNMVSLYQRTPFGRLTEKKWNLNIDANLKSAYLTVLASAPLLRKKGGRIIHFSDWIADSGRPRYKDFLPYYTAKAGLLGLTQAQALELAPHVLVNAIAPGPILPPKNLSEKENKEVKRVTPLGKWGGSREIAKTVLFLAETDFVTGECIRVDGGRHLL